MRFHSVLRLPQPAAGVVGVGRDRTSPSRIRHPRSPCFRPAARTRLSLGGVDPALAFSSINNAYSVLVDDYERTRFHAMESMLEEDISRLGEIKRRNAMLDVELMQVSLGALPRLPLCPRHTRGPTSAARRLWLRRASRRASRATTAVAMANTPRAARLLTHAAHDACDVRLRRRKRSKPASRTSSTATASW